MNAGFAALADLAATTTTDFFSAAIVVTWAPRGLMGASWSVAQYGAVPVVNVRTCAGRASGSESACHLIGRVRVCGGSVGLLSEDAVTEVPGSH